MGTMRPTPSAAKLPITVPTAAGIGTNPRHLIGVQAGFDGRFRQSRIDIEIAVKEQIAQYAHRQTGQAFQDRFDEFVGERIVRPQGCLNGLNDCSTSFSLCRMHKLKLVLQHHRPESFRPDMPRIKDICFSEKGRQNPRRCACAA